MVFSRVSGEGVCPFERDNLRVLHRADQMLLQDSQAALIKYDIQKVTDNVVDPLFTVVLIARIVDSLTIPLLLSILAAAYVFLPINETHTKAKKIQLMTGISSTRYWFMSFIIDLMSYTIANFIALLPLFILDPHGVNKSNILLCESGNLHPLVAVHLSSMPAALGEGITLDGGLSVGTARKVAMMHRTAKRDLPE
ncbi:hypothetical protein HPB48_003374 [Haemaphysalis longicornis]|uniref:Uncharacterized protein n=1 Tax=Haemaphysalis longicornis TaxID=44386 RepID=A0A9J6GF81_HAELO|nr:hypothetical protein HPB48_003374 [Haemaphysalis longicornis]